MIARAFLQHVPSVEPGRAQQCGCCTQRWPCSQVAAGVPAAGEILAVPIDQDIRSEQPADALQVVYDYLRTATNQTPTLAAYEAKFVAWCERESWHLGAMFRDIGVAPEALIRPAITPAFDALQLPGSDTLVVMTCGHLSTVNTVVTRLRFERRRTGATPLIKTERAPAACHGAAADVTDSDRNDDAGTA
ncbi:hypothetical protein [Haloechinothrix halophila]|uniref:hypothetical protein n=1 Tax=Haloechinothrix halophila TaxID=1069073 RepID=UPI0012FBF420|nr:hypothetical protein [Haloechinothrix halophila]